MKSSPKFISLFAVLGIICVLMTGISLYAFSGIEDEVIIFSWGNNGLFSIIDQAKIITIITNLVGLLIISFIWNRSLQKSSEQNRQQYACCLGMIRNGLQNGF
ncbi:hypothetical protein ACFLZ5_05305 [Thermodesulfobacteriota bacterium]